MSGAVDGAASRERASRELAQIDDLIARTRARVDPHAFHFVHWGAIVLVWYPLGNWLQSDGRTTELIVLGVVAVVLGFLISATRERKLRSSRLPGEDTGLARQVGIVVAANVGCGFLFSGLAPATGLIAGENVPILWGLVYANLAFTTGLLYERDFCVAGAVILVGVVLATLFQPYNGYILGPFMGLGMIVPGLRAEARVRRLREDAGVGAA